jgi:hypothetical protein
MQNNPRTEYAYRITILILYDTLSWISTQLGIRLSPTSWSHTLNLLLIYHSTTMIETEKKVSIIPPFQPQENYVSIIHSHYPFLQTR